MVSYSSGCGEDLEVEYSSVASACGDTTEVLFILTSKCFDPDTCVRYFTVAPCLSITGYVPNMSGGAGTRTVCAGSNTNFRVNYSVSGGATAQWQVSEDMGATWGSIIHTHTVTNGAGFTRLNLSNVDPAWNGNKYRVILTGTASGCQVISDTFMLVVNGPIVFDKQPVDACVCPSASMASFSATTNAGAVLRWQFFNPNTNIWTNFGNNLHISGATSDSL
ncbi:MAG: hypothetical protein ACK4NS_13585, partial [Saprospiraceae bacterium]